MNVENQEVEDNQESEQKPFDVLETAKKRFKHSEERWHDVYTLAKEDLEFSSGEQWDDEIKRQREEDGRPILTINRIPQFIRQIINDIRQNKPSIKVSPVDDKGDIETAKILQGIIRHIEYSSNADSAYDRGADSAVRCGIGFLRVVTEYDGPLSFDQVIKIKSVRNRFSCYLDPDFQEPDGSDAAYGFAFDDLSHEEFKAQYPKAELPHENFWGKEDLADWVEKDKVRVAEYFYREFEEKTIVRLTDGSVCLEEEIEEKLLKSTLSGQPVQIAVDKATGQPLTRKTQVPVIKWCKLSGCEVLEETTWAGMYIPIVPVLGEELDIAGERILEGVVRHAKDSQRIYNIQASNEVEAIALAPKAPYIGAAEQFEGYENIWKNANVKAFAFLPYKNIQGLPPPQRNFGEPAIAAINQSRQMAAEDLKATTGIYDAALGNRSNENSGVAIQRRAMQAQTSNFHFVDNLSKSIRHVGRILIDLIPKIYDTERAIRILGEDGTEDVVYINTLFKHDGKNVHYDLGSGKYDVTVNTGPSFETKRQEAVQAMLEFTKSMPQASQAIGDLLVKNMDWPGAQEISERLKKLVPPGIIEEKGQSQPLPPQVQQQMQQMDQMIQQLTQQLNDAHQERETDKAKFDAQERQLAMKLETESAIALAKLQSNEAIELLYHQIAELDARQKQFEASLPQENQNQNQSFQNGNQSPDQALMPEQQNPTGGSPGQFME